MTPRTKKLIAKTLELCGQVINAVRGGAGSGNFGHGGRPGQVGGSGGGGGKVDSKFGFKVGDDVKVQHGITGKFAHGRIIGFTPKAVKVQFKNLFDEYMTDVFGKPMYELIPPHRVQNDVR